MFIQIALRYSGKSAMIESSSKLAERHKKGRRAMIAKYSGTCKVTGKAIIAGVTEIEKVNGVWQAKPAAGKYEDRLAGITTSHVKATYRHPKTGELFVKYWGRQLMATKASTWEYIVSVEPHEMPTYWELPENQEGALDRQWRIDGGR